MANRHFSRFVRDCCKGFFKDARRRIVGKRKQGQKVSATMLAFETCEDRLVLTGGLLFNPQDLPELHSAPQFATKIYLDFDGTDIGEVFRSPGFYVDSDGAPRTRSSAPFHINNEQLNPNDGPRTLSQFEIEWIHDTWRGVAEDFAPFQVDVTTKRPDPSQGDIWGVRVLFTSQFDNVALGGDGSQWTSGNNGIANDGGFGLEEIEPFGLPAFPTVYSFGGANIPFAGALGSAFIATHEVGHTFGLEHDVFSSLHGEGPRAWAPLLSSAIDAEISQWDNGLFVGAVNQEDDLSIIEEFIPYRDDDHGNLLTLSSATQLSDNNGFSANGVIERSIELIETTVADPDNPDRLIRTQIPDPNGRGNDVDVFSFEVAAEQTEVAIDLQVAEFEFNTSRSAANLNARIDLFDFAGNLVAFSDPNEQLDAQLNLILESGVYFIQIDGVGQGDPFVDNMRSYSEYGSLGQYNISVTQSASVVDVTLSNTNGFHEPFVVPTGNGDQIRSASIGGVNSISIEFSKDVGFEFFVPPNARPTDLQVRPDEGIAIRDSLRIANTQTNADIYPGLSLADFSYVDNVATWNFSEAFPAGAFAIFLDDGIIDSEGNALNGEWDNPLALSDSSSSRSSGDLTPGGDFEFHFTYLPADFNHDNVVDAQDQEILNNNFSTTNVTHSQGDANGDGVVDIIDLGILGSQFGFVFNRDINDPILGSTFVVDTLVDENDGDYSAGDRSVREVLEQAGFVGGTQTITFADSLFTSDALQTLALTEGVLTIDSELTVDGPGADLLAISGGHQSRIFEVTGTGSTNVEITGLTISEGGQGAILVNDADLTIRSSRLIDSQGDAAGGAISSLRSDLHIFDSEIADNSAAYVGGAIYFNGINQGNTNHTLQIHNSTISGNDAWTTIYIDGNVIVDLLNDTITQNSAGGIYAATPNSLALFNNTIIADNGWASDVSSNFTVWASENNLIGTDDSGQFSIDQVGVTAAGLALTPLGFYGGTTRTHALLSGSVALDAGGSSSLANDQRGVGRLNAVDIGAYEHRLEVDTLDDEDDGDYSSGDLSLREALGLASILPEASTVTFDSSLFTTGSQALILTHDVTGNGVADALKFSGSVTLQGPGADLLTISGNNAARIFEIQVNGGAQATINDITLSGGLATGIKKAGGIALNSSSSAGGRLTVTNTRIVGNTGSGIGSAGADLRIINSEISDNHNLVGNGGGVAFWQNLGTARKLEIVNSTISGNSSTDFGGGVFVGSAFASQNTAVRITNTTISDNASADAGGLYIGNSYGPSHPVEINNTIIAGNNSVSDVSGGFINAGAGNNLIGIDASGVFDASQIGFTESEVALAPLGFYGGDTRTHGLLDQSIAIDAGNDSLSLATDQRGDLRLNSSDVGAFELHSSLLDVDTLTDELDDDFSRGDRSLREVLELAKVVEGADVITFSPLLFTGGATTFIPSYNSPNDLDLIADRLVVRDNVVIQGPGADLLTISGGGRASAVFFAGSYSAELSGVTLTDGVNGGVDVEIDDLVLRNVRIVDNNGSGVSTGTTNLTIINSEISDNQTASDGGGISLSNGLGSSSMLTIINSTISGNIAGQNGGGISFGGAYSVYSPRINIINSTITNNTSSQGGALHASSTSVARTQVEIRNSILAGSNAVSDISGDFDLIDPSLSFNLVGVDATSQLPLSQTGFTSQSLGVTSLDFHGGTTRTHALRENSPAIDAGDDAIAITYGLSEDQRGEDRFEDGDNDTLEDIDIGAFELAADEFFGTL